MSPSLRSSPSAGSAPSGLVALVCPQCGAALADGEGPGGGGRGIVGVDPGVYPCGRCGRAWGPVAAGMAEVPVAGAGITTELRRPDHPVWLPVWRLRADVRVSAKRSESGMPPELVWSQVRRRAGGAPCLYVPAFRLQKTVVAQLGLRLTERQPEVTLQGGAPRVGLSVAAGSFGPHGSDDAGSREAGSTGWGLAPSPGRYPVLLSEDDARVVAHFVYLALESQATPGLKSIEYDLGLGPAHLVFFPAEYDVRYVRDSNWRFLLREFDALVD